MLFVCSPSGHIEHDDHPNPDEYLPTPHAIQAVAPAKENLPAGHTTHDVLVTGKYQPDPQHNAWIHTNPSPPAEGSTPLVVPADPTPTPDT